MTLQGLLVRWRQASAFGLLLLNAAVVRGDQGDENWDGLIGNPGVAESVGGIGVVLYRNDLYIFGAFNSVGGVAATNIAKRADVTWLSLAGGVRGGHIGAATASTSNLFVGGSFGAAGSVVASNVARWDGTSWATLGTGVNGLVRAIAVRDNEVFVGGSLTLAGGIAVNNIAKWDGTNWSALGDGIVPVFESGEWVGAVDSLAVSGTDVLVGGRYRNAGGIGATNIARWDGTNWHALGNGLRNFDGPGSENGAVHALTVHQGYLFAGGSFRKAGDTEATNLACWDGVTWNTVGSGVSDALSVLTLAPNGSDLYAGGAFRSIGGVGANRLARWDGLAWFPLGSGIGGQLGDGPLSLATSGTELYVGGYFRSAGGKPSTNIALWHIPHSLTITQTIDAVRLSWPATGTNFALEAQRILAETNWSEVSPSPVVHTTECVVTQSVSGATQFYRLRRR